MARILIIDDEASIRRTLREILEYEKYKVDDAGNGKEALAQIAEHEYDVILCDIKMPEMDGIELLGILRQSCETPVIMISGHGTIETAVEAIKMGAYDYIAKPPDLNRLLITIKNALDKSKLLTETKILRKAIKIGRAHV